MITIATRYRGPTNTKPARIVALTQGRHHVVPYDDSRSASQNHAKACAELAYRLDLPGAWLQLEPPTHAMEGWWWVRKQDAENATVY